MSLRRTAPLTAVQQPMPPARVAAPPPERQPPPEPPVQIIAAGPAKQVLPPPRPGPSARPAEAPTPVAPPPAEAVVEVPTAEPPPPAARPTLNDELRALSKALHASDEGRWADALATLDAYSRDIPHGALQDEAAVLRVRALCELGRSAEGESLARQLIAASPTNPAVQVLRTGCLTDAGAR
ncbi:MAG: hypothetical protein JNG84_07545 [Archangium sp.]|nr:hypothetical protein [Archangium sp.]